MPRYTIPCRITLNGAVMIVDAESAEDALAKAKKNDFEDIEYDLAELVDWELRGEPQGETK